MEPMAGLVGRLPGKENDAVMTPADVTGAVGAGGVAANSGGAAVVESTTADAAAEAKKGGD
jgi:hypothetical protein